MKTHFKSSSAAAAFSLLLLAIQLAPQAAAQNARHGGETYKLCASCHGFKGQGNKLVNAPSLAGREGWYLERQLRNFRDGIRGTAADDTPGRTMATMTAGLADDGKIADLVAYIATLPSAPRKVHVDGDAATGKGLYAACAACHGSNAEGNAALNAPALKGIDDWYQVAQIEKFRAGQRGAHPQDTYGQQMAPMAKILADEKALRDVAAYVYSIE